MSRNPDPHGNKAWCTVSTFAYFQRSFLKAPDLSALPPRVRQQVRERDFANERLLRFIQLSIILVFCIIYAISPKTHPPGAFVPVPFVLSGYLVLSIIGVIWILMREPPDWSVFMSILFDFTLLYGLMVSFHIQYEQPASFVLKAPALLYVFIFIAIRALRFHPKFVLTAGMVATAGWAAMILYVVRIDPGDNMLTRSYVEYLTSNSILIGAEMDKILSILLVTAILALVVNGSNNLLVTATSEQTAAADLSRFFDTSVAEDIRSNRMQLEAGKGEARIATIMFIDIRRFTVLAADMHPDRVMQLLSAYQGHVITAMRAHGGIIDKFMGDGIMVTFGTEANADPDGRDAAGRALAAAARLIGEAQNWVGSDPVISQVADQAGPVEIAIGMATGEVAFGAVGFENRLEMTVIGAPVNLAAKLEKHNKALSSNLICDAATWNAAQAWHDRLPLAAETLTTPIEGVRKPVEIVKLTLAETQKVPVAMPNPGNAASLDLNRAPE